MFPERSAKRQRIDHAVCSSSSMAMSHCYCLTSGLTNGDLDTCCSNGTASSSTPSSCGLENNPEHSLRIMHGLNKLQRDRILCDVTLIAEGERFDVHKVILVSCSDYFLSMFTSGMKESNQSEIELKGVTSKGLKKVIEIIYTSTTTLEGDDIFDVIAAATHLQVTPVIEFCEQNFLSGMTTANFYDFISTARLYSMFSALRQIDAFIAQNLLQIEMDGSLPLLTYEHMVACLSYPGLNAKEIDIFTVVWEWIKCDPSREQHAVSLMSYIRFPLISPSQLVNRVQRVDAMITCPELRAMVLSALNYHVVPHAQPIHQSPSTVMRCREERLVSVGGREIHPHPGLHDNVLSTELTMDTSALGNRVDFTKLPAALSHMQVVVFGDFLYVLGGCTTQCAHGESAVNTVHRYDPRFNVWFQAASMINKRAYFYAGLMDNYIYAIGGKHKDGSLSSVEFYDAFQDEWHTARSLPLAYHAHAGCVVAGQGLYISGGYSNNHFTPDLLKCDTSEDPLSPTWRELSPMLTARGWHVMCTLPSHDGTRLLVAGGCNLNTSQQALPVLQAECYDTTTDQWTLIAPLSISHKEASCVVHGSTVFIIGGYNVQTKTGQKSVSRYDSLTGVWDTVGTLPTSRTGVGYCVMGLRAAGSEAATSLDISD